MADDLSTDVPPATHFVVFSAPLPAAAQSAIRALAGQSQRADGSPPFSDQTLLSLPAHQSLYGVLALARDTDLADMQDEDLLGAVVVADSVLELTTHPAHRDQGIASTLLETLRGAFSDDELKTVDAWRHGSDTKADKFAITYDFRPVRELWKMSVTADRTFPAPELADGIRLRTFQPGTDEQPWLELNAAAFADHPEQGKLTLEDLNARQAEDWFDADGFFLAENTSGDLVAFHWTKIVTPSSPDEPRVGEVYVVGVSPQAQGQGLGLALTLAGLEYLAQKVDVIELYVDADNIPAVGLYRKLGFERATVDVMYQHSSRAKN